MMEVPMPTRLLILALALLLLAVPIVAQVDKAAIDAVALDQSQAPLPGVTVTLTRPETGLSIVALTDSSGTARFNSLSPGKYAIEFALEGFAPLKQPNVALLVGQ